MKPYTDSAFEGKQSNSLKKIESTKDCLTARQ